MAAPNGLIVAWPSTAASIPSGWSRYATLNSVVPKPASSSITTTGGSDTHTHSGSSHQHTDAHSHSSTATDSSGSVVTGGNTGAFGVPFDVGTHTHSIATTGNASTNVDAQTGTTSTGTSIGFSRLSVIWIQADGTTDIPTNAVAYSNQAVTPTGW